MLTVDCYPCKQDELDTLAKLTQRAQDPQGMPLRARPWKEFRMGDDNWELCLDLGQRAGWKPEGTYRPNKRGSTPAFEASAYYGAIGYGYPGTPAVILLDDGNAWADALERVLRQPAMWPAAGKTAVEGPYNRVDQATVVAVDPWGGLKLTTTKIKALIDWLRLGDFGFAMDD